MNTVYIAQAAEQTVLASQLIQNSAIQAIRLVRSKVELAVLSGGPPAPLVVSFNFGATREPSPTDCLRLLVNFQMAGVPESPDEGEAPPAAAVVEIDCAFRVEYALRPGFEPSDAQIEAFQEGNAIFNAWPYFREYLQSTLQRMGLPTFTLPFLRLQPRADAPKAGEESTPARKARSGANPATKRRLRPSGK